MFTDAKEKSFPATTEAICGVLNISLKALHLVTQTQLDFNFKWITSNGRYNHKYAKKKKKTTNMY